MVKSFKEYTGAGIRIGGADSVVPMADLGDNPPKGQGGRDMRGVGLHASAKDHKKDYETFVQLYTKINKAVDDASKELNKITSKNKDRMGLIDPKIKSSSKYKRAKAQYDKVDDLRKRFLRGVPKDFMRKYTFEDKNPRIPRKPGQKAGSDKHSDLYTDENPRGTIHGLGFTDSAKAKQSVSKIRNSGKTHAHKMQAAIAMSQRAKVASQRAKDPEKKKDLGQAHKVYQSYIDTNKKEK